MQSAAMKTIFAKIEFCAEFLINCRNFLLARGGEAVIFYCLENCKEIEGREHNGRGSINGEGSTMEEGV